MNNRKQVNLQYYDSPCGRLVLASIDDELCLCDWNDMPSAERNMRRLARYTNASFKTDTSSVLEETKRQLDEYLPASASLSTYDFAWWVPISSMKRGTLC